MRILIILSMFLCTNTVFSQGSDWATTGTTKISPCKSGALDSLFLENIYASDNIAIIENMLIVRSGFGQIDTYLRENEEWIFSESYTYTPNSGYGNFIETIGESNLLLISKTQDTVYTLEKVGNEIILHDSTEIEVPCFNCGGIRNNLHMDQLVIISNDLTAWHEWTWQNGTWELNSSHQLTGITNGVGISFNPWLQKMVVSQLLTTQYSTIYSAALYIYSKNGNLEWQVEESINVPTSTDCDAFLPASPSSGAGLFVKSHEDFFVVSADNDVTKNPLKLRLLNSTWTLEAMEKPAGYRLGLNGFYKDHIARVVYNQETWIYEANSTSGYTVKSKLYGKYFGEDNEFYYTFYRIENGICCQYEVLCYPKSLTANEDCNQDFINDICDSDCNENQIPDACELLSNPELDCDANGLLDECEIGATYQGIWSQPVSTIGRWDATEEWVLIIGDPPTETVQLLKSTANGDIESTYSLPGLPSTYASTNPKLGPDYIAYSAQNLQKLAIQEMVFIEETLTLEEAEIDYHVDSIPNFSFLGSVGNITTMEDRIVISPEYYASNGPVAASIREIWILEDVNGVWERTSSIPADYYQYADEEILITDNFLYQWTSGSYQYQQSIGLPANSKIFRYNDFIFAIDHSAETLSTFHFNGSFWESGPSTMLLDGAEIMAALNGIVLIRNGSQYGPILQAYSFDSSSIGLLGTIEVPYKNDFNFNQNDFRYFNEGFIYRNYESDLFSSPNWCEYLPLLNTRYDFFRFSDPLSVLDCNQNFIIDTCETSENSNQDCNQNGILDSCETINNDCNFNGVPDSCETDCDGNGIIDECEISEGLSLDCNNNLIPDYCDFTSGFSSDCNNNGFLDDCEITQGFANDCDDNGQIDLCQIAAGDPDCNLNQIPDICDIANGEPDNNSNSIPDSCEGPTSGVQFQRGDVNEDLQVNIGDAVTTLDFLFTGGTITCTQSADLNNDSLINIADAISLLGYLFSNGPTPDDPFGFCGVDTEVGDLTCNSYSGCP